MRGLKSEFSKTALETLRNVTLRTVFELSPALSVDMKQPLVVYPFFTTVNMKFVGKTEMCLSCIYFLRNRKSTLTENDFLLSAKCGRTAQVVSWQ